MRKMNYKTLAAALLAIQIAVTAMPASALACENGVVEETAQEQTEMTAEVTEEAAQAEPEVVAKETVDAEAREEVEAETKEENFAEAAEENTVEETVEVAEETVDVTEDRTRDEAAVTEIEEQEQQAAAENQEEPKTSENSEQGKAFEQTVTVDGVKIKVSAEEGAFEEGSKLSVTRVPSTQLKEVQNAVADARAKDELVTSAYAFDIKIMGKDGSILQPAEGKKIKVSFETKEAADGGLGAVVYHIVNVNNNITAKKLATAINRNAKTAEAQTDGLSYYVVEFVSKNKAAENTETNTEANTAAKTDTNEDTDKHKTEDVTEDKTAKAETVTPAEKTNTENDTVKKETKTGNGVSEVKKEKKSETEKKSTVKEKKSENKKKETVKKDKTSSKKTEKAKASSKKSPKTGDTANMVIWLTMGALAAGGIIVLLVSRRKQM